MHLLVQAKQIAYNDRDLLLADPAFADVPVETLISKEYARKRAALIDPRAALPMGQGAVIRQPARAIPSTSRRSIATATPHR